MVRAIVILAFIMSGAMSLRAVPKKAVSKPPAVVAAAAAGSPPAIRTPSASEELPTPGDVDVERRKIQRLVSGLGAMLKANGGPFARSKIAPALKLFVDSLGKTLKDVTSTEAPAEAMRKLKNARAGAQGLISELTRQQENLMKEDVTQRESLLLGALMSRQSEPMQKQQEILRSADFADLDVSKVLLRGQDKKQALYMQAARYLDAQQGAGGKAAALANKVDSIAASLDKRVAALERESETREKHFKKKMAELSKLAKNSTKLEQRRLESTVRREERKFKKWAAVRKHDLASMRAAAEAVRKGDSKALDRARTALLKSLEALKSRSGGFLHLLQLGHRLLEEDCPYCAAQCVEGCHQRGDSYVGCLSTCADAGRDF